MASEDRFDGLRYKQGGSWSERQTKGVEDLADLRSHRGYAFLMDTWGGNIRTFFRQYLDPDISDEEALLARQKAIWTWAMMTELDELTSEKDLREAQDKLYQGFTADEALAAEHAAALAEAGRNQTAY